MNQENQEINVKKSLEANINQADSMYYLSLLLKHKWFIIISTSLGLIASIIISLSLPNWYKSTVNCVPPQKTAGSFFEGSIGAISSTLKEFGLTKFSNRSEGYSYTVILNTRTVKDSLIKKFNLAKVYDIPDSLTSLIYAEIDNNIEIANEKEGNYTISVYDKDPKRACEMANYYIEISNNLAQTIFRHEATTSKLYLESRLIAIDSSLKVISDSLSKYSKNKFVFSPLDQAKSISSAYAELKAEQVHQEIILDLMKNKFGEDDASTIAQKKLIENIKSKVSDAETKSGVFGNFPLSEATSIGIEYLRLYTSYEVFFKVKSYLMPMLEDTKLDESRQTQSLIIIDKAVPADKKTYPKRSLIVLGSVFGIFILSGLFVLIIESIKHLKFKYINFKKDTSE